MAGVDYSVGIWWCMSRTWSLIRIRKRVQTLGRAKRAVRVHEADGTELQPPAVDLLGLNMLATFHRHNHSKPNKVGKAKIKSAQAPAGVPRGRANDKTETEVRLDEGKPARRCRCRQKQGQKTLRQPTRYSCNCYRILNCRCCSGQGEVAVANLLLRGPYPWVLQGFATVARRHATQQSAQCYHVAEPCNNHAEVRSTVQNTQSL
jgi:hypothetical protein